MPWIYRPARQRVVHEEDAGGPPGPAPGPHPFALFGNPLLVLGFAALIVAIVVIVIALNQA